MKNLLLAFFILVSGAAYGQTTLTANYFSLSLNTTTTTQIDLPDHVTVGERNTVLIIKAPSTNVSTVQVNGISSTMTDAATLDPGEQIIITVRNKFWVKLANSADDLKIGW